MELKRRRRRDINGVKQLPIVKKKITIMAIKITKARTILKLSLSLKNQMKMKFEQ